MKKVLAMLIAVTAVLGTFTACGDEPESSVSEVSESSISESSEEETEPVTTETAETTAATKATTTAKTTKAAKTTAVTKTTAAAETEAVTTAEKSQENTDIPENSYTEVEHADEYIATLKKLFEAERNSDAMAMIELSFPTGVFDAMTKTGMIDVMLEQIGDVNNELAVEQLEDFESLDIKVVSARKPEPSELKFVRRQYSGVKGMCDCMINAGITYDMLLSNNLPENLTDEEILKLAEDITKYSDENADIELTVDFPSYEYVTFAFDDETIELPVFISEDGTAKIDLMMLGNSVIDN